MTKLNLPVRLTVGIAGLTFLLPTAGCSSTTSGSELDHVSELTSNCLADAKPAGSINMDGTDSTQSPALLESRWSAATDLATEVAACGGHLRISVFTSSASASTVLFDGDLIPTGATDIAKVRSVSKLVEQAIETAKADYAAAIAALPQDSTDVTASLGSAREYLEQLNASDQQYALTVLVLTDGIQNVGVSVGDPSLTSDDARASAAQAVLPDLSGATVTFAGIGRVSGNQPPTSYTDALKVFYETVCSSTHAASCTVVTDYTGR